MMTQIKSSCLSKHFSAVVCCHSFKVVWGSHRPQLKTGFLLSGVSVKFTNLVDSFTDLIDRNFTYFARRLKA